MENYLYPLLGGILIGVAASILLLFNGKIMGLSGILDSSLKWAPASIDWQYSFLLGLFITSIIGLNWFPEFFNYSLNEDFFRIGLGGFLVGVGTRLGGGCTSGHGVCGIPRRSKRSIMATIIFMIAGIVIVQLF